ncbi:hypothetical protein HYQ46_012966 [Verticillium longisporum]|nr:hypothetical protein HYQ46_012966 [Verticillium longisporum]
MGVEVVEYQQLGSSEVKIGWVVVPGAPPVHSVAPVDGKNHDTILGFSKAAIQSWVAKFHVDLSAESIDSMREVKALHSFSELLSDAVADKYQVRDLTTKRRRQH